MRHILTRTSHATTAILFLAMGCWIGQLPGWAASIDTAFLEQPWPKQWVHEYEVGKFPVRWRQRAHPQDGIFAGVSVLAPSQPQRTWELTTDYTDLGPMTPGVSAVRILERTPTRQVIQVEIKVLWKTLQLDFEVEQDPPRAVRFRLVNKVVGEYRGVCTMHAEGSGTRLEVATWLKPSVRVPSGLVLSVERMVFLRGIRNFLETCEQAARAVPT